MKKRHYYNLLILLMIVITGCHSPGRREEVIGDKIRVLSTTAMIGDLVSHIGGEYVVGDVLIKGELDPHSYEIVKGDDQKFEQAHIVFCNGLHLEHGISVKKKLNHHPRVVAVADRLLTHEGSILSSAGQYDPHVWLDLSLWAEVTEPIYTALTALDPSHQGYYFSRKEQLKEQLLTLDAEARKFFQQLPEERRFLVTSHDAFHYFVRRYLHPDWEDHVIAPEGLAPEMQVSTVDLMRVIDFIVQHDVRVVFPESNVSRNALEKIVLLLQKQGKPIRIAEEILYSDAMGNAESYYEMMKHNLTAVKKGLDHG